MSSQQIKIHVTASGRRIEPFGDPPRDVRIQNRPLADWQADMIEKAGFKCIDSVEPPCLQVPDTLFTTGQVLRRFVDTAAGRNAVLVLQDSVFARRTTPVQPFVVRCNLGFRFDTVRFISGGDEPPVEVPSDPEERLVHIPVPASLAGQTKIEFSLPRHPVITLHHWVHILWANEAAGGMLARNTPAAELARRGVWAFLRTLSLNRWKLLGKINDVGRGCDIHPSAVIEGSTLEDGASVGPFARVLFSRIGRNAVVMAGAQVEASVVGEGATVCQHTTVRLCVLYPGAVAGQRLMQMCILGHDVVTVEGAWSIDLNLERDCRVPLDGLLHSTGTRFLGSAFGHRSRVGTGFWLAHGRMIPNDALVVCAPDQVISRISSDLPSGVPLSNSGGTLRPADRDDVRSGGVNSRSNPG
jgi:hypothetical protein